MKVKTVLVAAAAAGAGYVLGTRAGRAKFEQLKARASELPTHRRPRKPLPRSPIWPSRMPASSPTRWLAS